MGQQETDQKKRGWREIEALRDKKLLRENLLDIWDDDWDIDEAEVLGDDYGVIMYADEEETADEDDVEFESDDDSDDFDDDEVYEEED